MGHDELLVEFIQILGRIKDLIGDAANSGDEELDLAKAVQELRRSGNTRDADELAELVQRADELQAQRP